jgi:hypothetical protein
MVNGSIKALSIATISPGFFGGRAGFAATPGIFQRLQGKIETAF